MNEQILTQLQNMNTRFESLESRMDAKFNMVMTTTVAMWVTTMAAVLAVLVTVLLKT